MNFTVFRRQGKGALWQILSLALISALFACDRAPSAPADNAAADARDTGAKSAPTAGVVTSGELPAAPRRIVSLAPNVTEILFDLGAGERIVGVTRFCDFPSEAKEIPKVGGIIDTDLEAILSMRPDLVVGTSSGADPKIARQLDDADIAYGFVRMDSLEETYRGVQMIGEFVGESEKGAALAERMRSAIDEVTESGLLEQNKRPRVLMVYGRNPLVAAGPETFGHELVEIAGGRNVMADAKTSYPKLDIEKVISLNPERIIDATMAGEGLDDEFWSQYASIDAVKQGHVYLIEDPVVLRPAPRLVEGLKTIRQAIEGKRRE